MRVPFMKLPLILALSAPLATWAQTAAVVRTVVPITPSAQSVPTVLFCSGSCFTVDANGARSPAVKGTPIQPGHSLETETGAYAQVKMSPTAAIAVNEKAKVTIQPKEIVLSEGRLRLIGGEAFGKPVPEPVLLRTNDGTFSLRNADVEMKTTATAPTLVKLNAGDARLGDRQLPKDPVQVGGNKVVDGQVALTDIVPPTKLVAPERAPATPIPARLPTVTPTLPPIITRTPLIDPIRISTTQPVVPEATKILNTRLESGKSLYEEIKPASTTPTTTTTTTKVYDFQTTNTPVIRPRL